jgi:PAS domain S-box-containing protein
MPRTAGGNPSADLPFNSAARRLEVLNEAAAMLLASSDPHLVLDRLYRRLAELLDVDLYFHYSKCGDGRLRLIAYGGVSPAVAQRHAELAFGEAVCGTVARTAAVIVVDDVQRRNDTMTESIRALGMTAYVCHPLVLGDRLLGTLSFGMKSRTHFSTDEIVLIRSVSDQVAIALHRQEESLKLRSSEQRLRLALDAGHMGTFEWNLRNDEMTWDVVQCRLFGVESGGKVNASRFWAAVHPDDRAMLQQLLDHQLNVLGGEFLEVEFRIVRPDGAVRWIAGRSRVSRDAEGTVQCINGVNFDITERRLAEYGLRESEARFRRLSESGILGVAFFEADGRITDANDKFLSMTGYSRAHLAQGIVRWDCLTPPEWIDRTHAAMDELQRTGRVTPYEKEYFRRDGTRFWGLFGGAEADGSGISFVLDISERKHAEQLLQQSEDRFRQAFEYAPVGMVLKDLEYRFLHVNRAYCAIVGYDATDLLQPDFNYQQLTHPDDRERNLNERNRLLTGKAPAFFIEKRYIRKDGNIVWVRVSGTVRRDANGQPFQVVELVEDITQRRRAEDALKEADRHKDDFLAALGHELRNPLAPIRNAMHILHLKGDQHPQIRWAADVTERQVQQMARLVDDLLDISRINRGQLQLRNDTVDLVDVIARSVEMTGPLIDSRRHRLDLQVPVESIHVRGDAARLTQILANLISNAVKYTPAQGTVTLTLEAQTNFALIRVRDSGVGIPPTALHYIFEPFRQLRPVEGSDQTSLGLGLALVKRLVQLHGGSVEAHSGGEGKGSEFRVRLPLAKAEATQRTRPAEQRLPMTDTLRIVVVDDNQDAAESLGALLQVLGHQAYPVFTGTEGVAVARRLQPDLVICDIGLPDITGYEVAAQLRREPGTRAARLVALTGYGRDRDKVLEAGFDEWLLKPADMASLQRVLHGRGAGEAGPNPSLH